MVRAFKIYVLDILLDVITTGYGIGRCYLTPSDMEVADDDYLRTSSIFKYRVSNPNVIDYFTDKLRKSGIIDDKTTYDEKWLKLKDCYVVGNGSIGYRIDIVGYSNMIDVELVIHNISAHEELLTQGLIKVIELKL